MADSSTGRLLHASRPVQIVGASLDRARAAMIMIHGRGASAASILSLMPMLIDETEPTSSRFAFLAPEADQGTWYPNRFIAPIESNEPWLSAALDAVGRCVEMAVEAGISRDYVVLLGFSQGACLALEYAARHAERYGGIIGLSGALIGPDDTKRDYTGNLEETPVFLGCGTPDAHIPEGMVRSTGEALERLGGKVTGKIYPGIGHTIVDDEIAHVRRIMEWARRLDS